MTGLTGAKLERYLRADCVLLALAVSARTGWPPVQIIEDTDPDDLDVRHVLVQMPDGRLLDDAGPHEDYGPADPFDPAERETDSWMAPEALLWPSPAGRPSARMSPGSQPGRYPAGGHPAFSHAVNARLLSAAAAALAARSAARATR